MADIINSNEIQIEQIETRCVPNYPKLHIFPQANNKKTELFDFKRFYNGINVLVTPT